MIKRMPYIILSLFFSAQLLAFLESAVVKEPIVAMNVSPANLDQLAASPETSKCQRSHQALFNELVDCIDEDGDYYKIASKNTAYGLDTETQKPLNFYWAKKEGFALLKDIPDLQSSIPTSSYAQQPTVVLTLPWSQFSVATRFKHLPDLDIEDSYAIELPDYQENSLKTAFVPKSSALVEKSCDLCQSRKLMVSTLKKLLATLQAQNKDAVIPYIWGGSSFITPHQADDFALIDGCWQRTEKANVDYTGYDCSELVLRFAQIAGLAFPYKTSSFMEKNLQPLADTDIIEPGDIIWVPSHVMIVSDVEHNELIEAAGYSRGHGCVHAINLEDCFVGISDYEELRALHKEQSTVTFKAKDGQPFGNPRPVKILKLQ